MMILSFIGIIFVVLGHTDHDLNFFSNLFPIYSFHMALFVFISGYFYKETNEDDLKEYILSRTKKFLIPYLIWNVIYGLLLFILKLFNVVDFGDDFNLYSLFVRPWIDGHQFQFNLASWFLLALFLVNIIYVLIRKLMKKLNLWNDYIFLSIFFIICLISICFSYTSDNYMIPLLRTGFFIFFYQLGFVYNLLESKIKIPSLLILVIIIMIQLFILKIEPNLRYIVVYMEFSGKTILAPIITSITGIAFWLTVSDILVPAFKNIKIVNYISSHTKEIMFHHIFWIFVINSIIRLFGFNDFDNYEYMNNIYYSYTFGIPIFGLVYTLLCTLMPVLFHYLYEKYFYKYILKIKKKINV